jgi:hypothetical protein
MRERKKSLSRSTFKKQIDILEGRYTNANNEWADWLLSKKGDVVDRLMKMTIMEYMKKYINRLPDWAKTFSAKGVTETDILTKPDKYFLHIIRDGLNKRTLEREIIETDGKINMIVERIRNARGHCKQTTVIIPEGDKTFKYRQENWISAGKWRVEVDHSFKNIDGFYTDSDFMKSTRPWIELINK